MRKEAVIAIFIGLVIGFVATFGFIRANKSITEQNSASSNSKSFTNTSEKSKTANENGEIQNSTISLLAPEDMSVISENPFLLSGITKSNSLLTISTEEKDYYLSSNSSGSFSQNIDVIGGLNQILLKSSSDTISENKVSVVYSTEIVQPSKEDDKINNLDDKVNQKLENASNKIRAFIGSVTDKTSDNIQIKDANGNFQIVGISTNTNFVKTGNKPTTLKYSDLAIGDFIIAMGSVNGQEVVEAKRVLVTTPIENPKRKIVIGKVNEIVKKQISIIENGIEVKLTFPKKWQGPEIKELKIGDTVGLVYQDLEGVDTIRSIEILNEKITPTPIGN